MNTNECPPILPLQRAARRFGVSARWLRQEALAGRIPSLNAGGRLLFNTEALQATLAKRAAELANGVEDGGGA